MSLKSIVGFLLGLMLATAVVGQSTEVTYQGQLQNAGAAANGSFDIEFALFSSPAGGSQLGSTLNRSAVNVQNGIFSVTLDFGNQFDGSSRFLEIRVRQSGGGAFTTLSPRQIISSSPYAVRSLDSQNAAFAQNATNAVNATNLLGPLAGDVTGTQASTTVARLRGTNVAANLPTNGQVLKFNSGANQWQPAADDTGSGGGGGTITGVTAGTGLTGGGTTGTVALAIANGGVGTNELASSAVNTSKIADVAVTDPKIAAGQVVKSINTLKDNVTLAAGSNVTITPSGNTLTITSTGGSGNAIINQTTQQAGADFNISGSGTANVFSAATQYNIGPDRVLSISGTNNLFAGVGAGPVNSGVGNAFFGRRAGFSNTSGFVNAFFGNESGTANTTGSENSFFGAGAGFVNSTGDRNSFFGAGAGDFNSTGRINAFFGRSAGANNTIGFGNSFFGETAGFANTTGSGNTAVGNSANVGSSALSNATAIGANARVDQSNSIVLGGINGLNGASADTSVGIGTTSPAARLHVKGGFPVVRIDGAATGSPNRAFINFHDSAGAAMGFVGDEAVQNTATYLGSYVGDVVLFPSIGETLRATSGGRVGIGTASPTEKLDVDGDVIIGTSGTNGCLKNNNGGTIIGSCSSDLRFKRDIVSFENVLDRLTRLQPRYFYWRSTEFPDRGFGSAREIGLIAQEVEEVLPQLVSTDQNGFKAVDYSRLPLLTIQAVREQQAQIEEQARQLKRQQVIIDSLRKLACQHNPQADVCKE